MKNSMKNKTILNLASILSFCLVARTSVLSQGNTGKKSDFTERAIITRNTWLIIKSSSKTNPSSELGAAQESLKTNAPLALRDYLTARSTYLKGGVLNSESLLSEHSDSMIVEGIALLMEASPNFKEKRALYTEMLADLLPISNWRSSADESKSDFPPRYRRPRVPKLLRLYDKELRAIASEFERAGISDLAWRAHLEAIYSSAPPWTAESHVTNWLSEEVAENWRKVAESVRTAGKSELGTEFLFKAIVFGAESSLHENEKTRVKWSTGATIESVSKDVKSDALTKIVHLYAEINAHPRALKLLDDYPDSFENVKKLRKDIEEQWMAIVMRIKPGSADAKVTLYGTEVFPHGDPLKVRIPWAFSDEAIRSARARARNKK
jgi:hypothetical protein